MFTSLLLFIAYCAGGSSYTGSCMGGAAVITANGVIGTSSGDANPGIQIDAHL